jgi:hypothetical protein
MADWTGEGTSPVEHISAKSLTNIEISDPVVKHPMQSFL